MKILLDTSAILVHARDEPGAVRVEQILSSGPDSVAIASPTVLELGIRLGELMESPEEAKRVLTAYTEDLTTILPIDADVARAALALRCAAPDWVPTVDLLIAACASIHGLRLVHRDRHLALLTTSGLVKGELLTG